MATREKESYKCPICASLRIVKYSRRNKPYIICDECGMQLFVRGKKAEEYFKRYIITGDFEEEVFGMKSDAAYYESLKKELEEVDQKFYYGQMEEKYYKYVKARIEDKIRKIELILKKRG